MTAVTGVCVSSCDDFFTTDPDNIINVGDYISTENEMYRGFLGIITRMQNAGDHAIFLTDPRCNFLEIAPNAPVALRISTTTSRPTVMNTPILPAITRSLPPATTISTRWPSISVRSARR